MASDALKRRTLDPTVVAMTINALSKEIILSLLRLCCEVHMQGPILMAEPDLTARPNGASSLLLPL